MKTTDRLSSTAGPTLTVIRQKKHTQKTKGENMNVNLCDCGLRVTWGPDPD